MDEVTIIGATAQTSAGHCPEAQKAYDRAAAVVRRIKKGNRTHE